MANRVLDDYADTRLAVAVNTGPVGAITGIKVDGTGYRRARFTFTFGVPTTSANLSAGAGIWNAATSGGVYAQITGASMAAISSGAISSAVAIVEVRVDPAKPWLLVSNMSMVSSDCANSATVTLYEGERNPPSVSTPQQIVVTN